MKLAINILISLAMLALCLWLVWPDAHVRHELAQKLRPSELRALWPYLAAFVALLAVTHFFRAWRWNNLLRPMGVSLPPTKLLAISSVGFMAILALPARLGELVRPALLRKKGQVSASAVLGTVAVERIVDGLVVSLLVFFCFALGDATYPESWMMPMAYISLGVFLAATTFLALALTWPTGTVKAAVNLTLARRLAPRVAAKLEDKLHKLISGFLVLKDGPNLLWFIAWSAAYWIANGMSMWVLAQGLALDLPVLGAFATMGVIAVGITLPNSPGLVGQFHYAAKRGMLLYLPASAEPGILAYAILLHGIQVAWYVGVGALAMFTSHVSLADVTRGWSDGEGKALEEEAA